MDPTPDFNPGLLNSGTKRKQADNPDNFSSSDKKKNRTVAQVAAESLSEPSKGKRKEQELVLSQPVKKTRTELPKIPVFDPAKGEFLIVQEERLLSTVISPDNIQEQVQNVCNFFTTHKEYLLKFSPGLKSYMAALSRYVKMKVIDPAHFSLEQKKVIRKIMNTLRTEKVADYCLFTFPDDRLFAIKIMGHIHGDSFLENSGLEGGSLKAHIETLLSYLKNFQNYPGFQDLIELIENVLPYFNACDQLRFLTDDTFNTLQKIASNIAEDVKTLPLGKKMLLPGGWKSKGIGHALLYLIERDLDGSYHFTVINTGGGIGYHRSKMIGTQIKHEADYRLSHVDESLVTDPSIYQALYKLFIIGTEDGREEWKHGSADLYERILFALGGKKNDMPISDEALIRPQYSGVCSWKVLMKLISLYIPKDEYKNFVFNLKKDSLFYYLLFLKPFTLSIDEINLLKRAVSPFVKYTLKAFKTGSINEKDLSLGKTVSENILSFIRSNAARVFNHFKTNNVIRMNGDREKRTVEFPKSIETGHRVYPVTSILTGNIEPADIRKCFNGLDEISEQVMDSLAFIRRCIKSNQPHLALLHIEALVSFLPLVSSDEDWDSLCLRVPGDMVEALINGIGDLSRLYFVCVANPTLTEKERPEHLATLIILLNMTARLTNYLPKDHLLCSSDFQKINTNILLNFSQVSIKSCIVNPYIQVHGLKMKQQFQSALKYGHKVYTERNYFNLMRDKDARYFQIRLLLDGTFPKGDSLAEAQNRFMCGLIQLIESDEFTLNFEKKFKKSKSRLSHKKLLEMTLEHLNELAPRSYCLALNQCLLVDYLYRNPKLQHSAIPLTCDEFAGRLSGKILNDSSVSRVSYMFSFYLSGDPFQNNDFNQNDFLSSFGSSYKASSQREKGLKNIFGKYRPCLKEVKSGQIKATHGSEAALSEAQIGLEKKETQRLSYLVSDKRIAVFNMISLLKEESTFLLDPENFQFIDHVLFTDTHMLYWVRTSPHIIESFQDSLVESLQVAKLIQNIPAALFMIQLLEKISQFSNQDPKISLLDEAVFIFDHLDEFDSKRAQAASLLIRIVGDRESLSENHVFILHAAFAYLQWTGFQSLSGQIKADVFSIIMKKIRFMRALGEDQKRELGQVIFQKFMRMEQALIEVDEHECHEKQSQISYNFNDLLIRQNGQSISPMPIKILSHPFYIKYFGGKERKAVEIEPGLYEFSHRSSSEAEKSLYRTFISQESHEVIFLKKIESDWYQKINNASSSLWINSHILWASGDKLQIFCEGGNGRMASKLVYDPDLNKYAIVKYNPESPKDYIPAISDTRLQFLGYFQGQDRALLWDKDSIVFPGLNLEFKAQGNRHVYTSDPNIYLSQTQEPPWGIPYLRSYLKVENIHRGIYYILPRRPFSLRFIRAGALSFTNILQGTANEFYLFHENQGHLYGKTCEECLYLGYLYYAQKQYHKAFKLFSQIEGGNPKGYSDREEEVVNWILVLLARSADHSPESIAVNLKFSLLVIRNLFPYSRDYKHVSQLNAKFALRTSALMLRYYKQRAHAKTLKLTPEEEIDLLDYCFKYLSKVDSLLVERYRMLKDVDFLTETQGGVFVEQLKSKTINTEMYSNALQTSLNRYLSAIKNEREMGRPLLKLKNIDEAFLKCEFSVFERYFASIELEELATLSKEKRNYLINQLKFMSMDNSQSDYRIKYTRLFYLFFLNQSEDVTKAFASICKQIIATPSRHPSAQAAILLNSLSKPGAVDIGVEDTFFTLYVKWMENYRGSPKAPGPVGAYKFKEAKSDKIEKRAFRVGTSLPAIVNSLDTFIQEHLSIVPSCEGEYSELIEWFAPLPEASPITKNEFEKLQKSLYAYEDKRSQLVSYHLGKSELGLIIDYSKQQINQLKRQMDHHVQQLLIMANQMPKDKLEEVRYKLKLLGIRKKGLTYTEIIQAFAQDRIESIIQSNPYLTQDDLDQITEHLLQFLTYATEYNHITRLHTASKNAVEKYDTEESEAMLANVNQLLQEKRQYTDPSASRMYLALEFFSGFRLREKQVEIIQSMRLSDRGQSANCIGQAIMGVGKSKLILPALAYLNSRGNNIPFLVVPDELFETCVTDLQKLSKQYVQQVCTVIEVPHEASLDIYDLEQILKKFEFIKLNRSFCIMKQSDIHSLRLQFRELILQLMFDNSNAIREKFKLLRQVLSLMKTEGDALLDEADLILDCLKMVNFSGIETKSPTKESKGLIVAILLMIQSDAELKEFFQLQCELNISFDKDYYTSYIRHRLIDCLLTDFFSFKEDKQAEIKEYLLKSKAITEMPKVMAQSDPKTQNNLALAKELINLYLPIVFSKNCNKDFGLSRIKESNIVIPYDPETKQPREGSEFGNHYEVMLFTILYYMRKGVKKAQIKQIIRSFQNQVIQELKSNKATLVDLKEMNAYKQFILFIGKEFFLDSNIDLFKLSEKDFDLITDHFNNHLEDRIRFTRLFAWNDIKIRTESLSSNSQHIVSLFRSVSGFTGTLWNDETFHPMLNIKPDLTADGKTLSLLYRMNPDMVVFSDLSDHLDTLFSALNGYQALIDVGAWFRDLSGIHTAGKMLSFLDKSIQGVVYINDVDTPLGTKGQAVILERNTQTPILLSDSRLTPKERFTYYNITTGTDIAQHRTAKALVTTGKNMTTRDLCQGVWRMRGLEHGQTIDFAVPKDLLKGKPFTLFDLFRLGVDNQSSLKESNSLKSLKHKMYHLIDEVIDQVILYSSVDDEKAAELAKKVSQSGMIVQKIYDEPRIAFGQPDTLLPIDAVKEHCKAAVKKNLSLLSEIDPLFLKQIDPEKVEAYLESLVHLDRLPAFSYYQTKETESQIQVRQKINVENKNEVEQTSSGRTYQMLPKETELWSSFWLMREDFTSKLALNHYLKNYQDDLKFSDNITSIFSPKISLSTNFRAVTSKEMINRTQFAGGIPFKAGTKPFGFYALFVNSINGIDLTFLDNLEAEYLNRMLQLESQFAYINEKWEGKLQKMKEYGTRLWDLHVDKYKELGADPEYPKACREEFIERGCIEMVGFSIEISDVVCDFDEYEHLKDKDHESVEKLFLTSEVTELEEKCEKIRDEFSKDWRGGLTYHEAYNKFSCYKEGSMYLMDSHLGLVQSGIDPLTEELKEHPEFIELTTQVKFLRGTLSDYSSKEEEYLKSWIKSNGADRMEQFFLMNILADRPEDQKFYPYSLLCRAINSSKA